jgi:cytochrome c oxidase subunit 1
VLEGNEGRDRHAGHEDAGHGSAGHSGIHMPSPSFYPLLAALGLPLIAYGVIYTNWLVADGILTLLVGVYGWALEPSAEPEPPAVAVSEME